jgi:hypothetical protein
MARETSAAIGELLRGFSGYVQSDAKSVYDLLFRPAVEGPPLDDGEPDLDERHEVGCWSHCRRDAWEVAITSKDPVAREAALRIKRIFDLDRSWRGKPPDEIRSLRELHLQPNTDAFFAWVAVEYERVKDQRGIVQERAGDWDSARRQVLGHAGSGELNRRGLPPSIGLEQSKAPRRK